MKKFNTIFLIVIFSGIFFIGGMYYDTFNNNTSSKDRQRVIDSLNLENEKLIQQNIGINKKIDSLLLDITTLEHKMDSIDSIILKKDSVITNLEKKKQQNTEKIKKLKPGEIANGLNDYLK